MERSKHLVESALVVSRLDEYYLIVQYQFCNHHYFFFRTFHQSFFKTGNHLKHRLEDSMFLSFPVYWWSVQGWCERYSFFFHFFPFFRSPWTMPWTCVYYLWIFF